MWEAGSGMQEQEVGNEKFVLSVMNDNEKGGILKFNVWSTKGITLTLNRLIRWILLSIRQ